MAFIYTARDALSCIDRASKVIKAQEFWAYRKARQAIADGIARRDSLIEAAQFAYEFERKRGYREGRDAARVEQSAHMIDIVSQTVDYFSKIEIQMIDLVMDAVKRIANDFDDHDKVAKVVRNSIALVRNQKFISVKVHPSQCSFIDGSIKDMLESYPAIEHIDVVGDSSLPEDACVIESDIGSIEASMSGQIEALRSTFKKVFGDPPAPCAFSEQAKPGSSQPAHETKNDSAGTPFIDGLDIQMSRTIEEQER